LRPFFIWRIAPEAARVAQDNVLSASVVTYLGVFDRSLVVPAVVAKGLVEARGIGELSLGIAIAASAEGCPAAGRELIDLCRSLT
jgi:hypothetical protein